MPLGSCFACGSHSPTGHIIPQTVRRVIRQIGGNCMAHGPFPCLLPAPRQKSIPRRAAGCIFDFCYANRLQTRPAATPMLYSSATINKFCLAIFVGAQQHRQPHACARAQPRHHASQRKLARGIQLGDEDRGHTVGNEPHKPGQHRLPRAAGRQECPYGLLAHQSHQRAQSNVEQQNEQK